MNIVALDTAVTAFGGVTFDAFRELGEFFAFDRTSRAALLERAAKAEALLVNKVQLSGDVLAELPNLKYIGVTATGYNNVDVESCRKRGIAVSNVVGYSTDSVAQLVLSFILDHFVRARDYGALVASGAWVASPDFCLPSIPQRELSSLTAGIVGLGTIGRRVAALARGFGMRVLYGETPGRSYTEPRMQLRELFWNSDVVSLHCTLSRDTERLIDAEKLSWMKPQTALINVSRGPLVDEAAVAAALHGGALGAYYSDVLSTEPPAAGNPLLSAPRTVLTPHIAWATPEARARLVSEALLNLKAFIDGERRNRVD